MSRRVSYELTTRATLPVMSQVRSSLGVSALAFTSFGLLVLVVIGLVVTPWQQSVSGQGRVIALSPAERHQRLESPVDGRISRVLVKEGQRVEQDEIIV
jgi:multidrug efflux pump subunit AcrA (membrane-fusion protein)